MKRFNYNIPNSPSPFGSPDSYRGPTRAWSDASREYRYGFNGKEKDFETANDNYDFGARIYDGRLGRWLSLDPLMYKSPSSSPFSYCLNNPIYYIDPDGRYPIQAQAISLADMMAAIRVYTINTYSYRWVPDIVIFGIVLTLKKEYYISSTKGITTLYELSYYFGSSYFGTNNGNSPKKYLYSRKWGWIDMRHFSFAAWQASKSYGKKVLDNGETIEYNQEHGNFPNYNGEMSAWSKEDLISNLLGVAFASYLNSSVAKGKSLLDNLNAFLNDIGCSDPFKIDEKTKKSPADLEPKEYSTNLEDNAQNFTYDPSEKDAPDKDKRNTETDKLILKLKEAQENDGGKDRRKAVEKKKSEQPKPIFNAF